MRHLQLTQPNTEEGRFPEIKVSIAAPPDPTRSNTAAMSSPFSFRVLGPIETRPFPPDRNGTLAFTAGEPFDICPPCAIGEQGARPDIYPAPDRPREMGRLIEAPSESVTPLEAKGTEECT